MLVESIRKMPLLLAYAAAKDDHWQLALPEAPQGMSEIVIALDGAQLVLRRALRDEERAGSADFSPTRRTEMAGKVSKSTWPLIRQLHDERFGA